MLVRKKLQMQYFIIPNIKVHIINLHHPSVGGNIEKSMET